MFEDLVDSAVDFREELRNQFMSTISVAAEATNDTVEEKEHFIEKVWNPISEEILDVIIESYDEGELKELMAYIKTDLYKKSVQVNSVITKILFDRIEKVVDEDQKNQDEEWQKKMDDLSKDLEDLPNPCLLEDDEFVWSSDDDGSIEARFEKGKE